MSLREMFNQLEDGVDVHTPFRFSLDWTVKGCGFGQLYFYEKDGKLYCENEYVGRETVKRILNAMVDQCTFTEVHDDQQQERDPV